MSDLDQWTIASGAGITALAVALCRAMEARRPDAVARDQWAECFVDAGRRAGPAGELLPAVDADPAGLDPLWASMPTYMGVRTRFFDDYFAEVIAAGIDQVVLIAAGLDTRAFRLDWQPGTLVLELDQGGVLAFKDEVLAEHGAKPRCDRRLVHADLRADWPGELRAAGLDPTRPTAWLVEGLLSYLPADAEARLFAEIRAMSPAGSRIGLECVPGNERDRVLTSRFATAADQTPFAVAPGLWQTELRPEPVDVLEAGGWDITVSTIAEIGKRYDRPILGVMSEPAAKTMLITGRR
ncbi:SAM-dependent methyltransferase [Dactylosporangium sp. NPDC051485]|uniref:SAM-dependent methyltransferase n=1 Tax=Dactylosporangium sp. NPDC051485 TaxID=3154846 RepID=UPI00342E28DC